MSKPRNLEHVPLLEALDDEPAADGAADEQAEPAAEGAADDQADWYKSWYRQDEQDLVYIGEYSVDSWVQYLIDEDDYARRRSAEELVNLGSETAPAVQEIGKLLQCNDPDTRQAAADVLSRLGRFAAPALPNLLAWISDEVVPDLISLFKHQKVRVRIEAVRALGNIGGGSAAVLDEMVDLLKDPNEYVQSATAEVLGQLGVSAVPALPQIMDLLASSDANVRAGASAALGEIGAAAAKAVPRLLPLLKDSDVRVRDKAALALGCIAGKLGAASSLSSDREVAGVGKALAHAMVDDSGCINEAAAEALSSLGRAGAEAVPEMVRLLSNAEPTIRMWTLWTLGKLGKVSASAVPYILTAMREANEDFIGPNWKCVSWAAMEALAKIGAAQPKSVAIALPALVLHMSDQDSYTRQRAVKALGSMGPAAKEAMKQITLLLQDDDRSVQEAASEALARISQEGELPV